MRKATFSISFLIITLSANASVPSGYYNTAEGKKAASLKTELHTIICQDTTHYLDYGSGAGKTWEGFYYTDRNTATNAVIDMYSDSLRYFPNPNPSFVAFGSAVEIEHSVPKSWWGCDITHPDCPAKDLNHLFPADGTTNMSKNDNPPGVVSGTPTKNNGVSKIGPAVYDGYVGAVFEPANQYKGDFARAYFYMATAYEHYARKWDTTKPENMMMNNTYPVLKPWAVQLLLQWHRQDPVSSKEVTRNDVVYGIQKNRNPFIDHPELVEYIWGDKTTIPYRLDGNIYFPYLKRPNNNDTLNLGKVSYSQVKDTTINLQAMNLTGDLTLLWGGTNASNFSLDKTIITKAEALAGYSLHIHYTAVGVGTQSAILTISGGGITTVSLRLKVVSTDEFTALSATNTATSSFVANWTSSGGATGYTLNVFTYQNTGTTPTTLLEEDFNLSLPNNWLKEGYTDNTLYSNIKMGTASTYGKITTPALDLSTATSTLTVRAKQFNNDTGSKLTATLDNNPLAVWTTAVGNQDFTVDMPVSTSISKVALSCIANKRVYVDYVKVVAQIPILNTVSIGGYPKSFGDVFAASVTGLQSNSTYYYTITPIGNGALSSNQIQVLTKIGTAVSQNSAGNVTWTTSQHGITVHNLSAGCTLVVRDMMGRTIQTFNTKNTELALLLPSKGMYIISVQQNQQTRTLKILY